MGGGGGGGRGEKGTRVGDFFTKTPKIGGGGGGRGEKGTRVSDFFYKDSKNFLFRFFSGGRGGSGSN